MKMFTKHLFVLIAFVCFTQVMSAQTVNQGAWMVGGSAQLDISKVKDADESTTQWELSPALGYYVIDDLAIGLGLSLYDLGDAFETQAAVGPFVRYYVADPIFLEAGADLELNEGGGTTIGARLGYSWFLNTGVAIEPALYFQSYSSDAFDITSFGLSIGIQAFAGRNE